MQIRKVTPLRGDSREVTVMSRSYVRVTYIETGLDPSTTRIEAAGSSRAFIRIVDVIEQFKDIATFYNSATKIPHNHHTYHRRRRRPKLTTHLSPIVTPSLLSDRSPDRSLVNDVQ